MSNKKNNLFISDDYLHDLFTPLYDTTDTLRELFDRRIEELKISTTNVLDILNTNSRTLNGILNGTQKTVDFTNLIKLSTFLQLPKEQVILLYVKSLEKNFANDTTSSKKIEFIKENFDLAILKKAGFIDSVTDFEHIENKIVSFFGLNEIFDYQKPPVDVAFSAGVIAPKNDLNRSFWIKSAIESFKQINNPHPYNREALIKYFPEIRWHSTNVELGLINIIKELYKIGITVIYQTPLPSLHLRGATVNVNHRPCIVLTDYRGFYPTLWFALIHELFHVIFDWDEIKNNLYHLSDAENTQLSVMEKEAEANSFAREYLFSKEKTKAVKPYLNNPEYVEEFARNNHVHPSFIYLFNAHDSQQSRIAFSRATTYNPDLSMAKLLKPLDNPWNSSKPINTFVKSIKYKLYN
jgi:HTH-type transcriptional regulator/antitoxin HigA